MGGKEENTEKKNTGRKRRISKKALMRRRQRRKKIIAVGVAAAAAVLAFIFVPRIAGYIQENMRGTDEEEEATEEVDISELRHISFDILSVAGSDTRVSAAEFSEALTQLYDEGYVLVDIYDMAETGEDGSISCSGKITVPQGKKPLIISQSDICYPLNAQENGTASKLVLESGKIKAQYTDSTGNTQTGDYDIVPILETFIENNPDFSYNGARAVLGVSGYSGVFGYRTTGYFSSEENNPYASYGTFNTENESEQAEEIVDALKSLGYRFASCGFAEDISYGAEISIVEEDLDNWKSEVEPVIGETDIILLPRQTDIGSWSGYDADNSKFELLSEAGFRFYFVGNNATAYMFQAGDSYVRQTVYEVHTMADFTNAFPEK